MKPTVFNYQDYVKLQEENKRLREENSNLQIRCRIAESEKPDRDCNNCKHQKPDGCSRWDCEYEPVTIDLISRADAIDTVEELNRKVNDGREFNTICTSDVLRRINALPSADAVEVESATIHNEGITFSYRKKGEWINKNGGLANCSICGERWGAWDVMNYCPNCGAKMVREDGEA